MSSKKFILKFVSAAGQHIIFSSPVIDVREEGSESGKRKEKSLICPSTLPHGMRAAEQRVCPSWRVFSDDV